MLIVVISLRRDSRSRRRRASDDGCLRVLFREVLGGEDVGVDVDGEVRVWTQEGVLFSRDAVDGEIDGASRGRSVVRAECVVGHGCSCGGCHGGERRRWMIGGFE